MHVSYLAELFLFIYTVSMANSLKKSAEEMKQSSWAETGSVIFAFLNVISASFGLLFSLLALLMCINEAITHTDVIDSFMWSACLSANFVVLVSFVFAIVLYLGINRQKPYCVLAYFIFGVTVLISLCSGLVILYYQDSNSYMKNKLREAFCDYYEPTIYTTVGISVVYALVLAMICRTWFLMTFRRSGDHEKLVNDYYESDWKADN